MLFAQRIRAWLGDLGMSCDYELPVVTRRPGQPLAEASTASGCVAFSAPDHGVSLMVALDVAA